MNEFLEGWNDLATCKAQVKIEDGKPKRVCVRDEDTENGCVPDELIEAELASHGFPGKVGPWGGVWNESCCVASYNNDENDDGDDCD